LGLSLLTDAAGQMLGDRYPLRDGLATAPARVINRNPATNTEYSHSLANEGGPQVLIGATLAGSNWTPYNRSFSHPYRVPMPMSLMATSQATGFYNSAVGLWPANGQDDQPSAYFNLIRLAPTTSARRGYTNPVGPNPTQVFYSPPIFGMQTRPIYATGL
jgi:hypothetical protein